MLEYWNSVVLVNFATSLVFFFAVLPFEPRKKKAYVRLTQDYDALDVANRIGII